MYATHYAGERDVRGGESGLRAVAASRDAREGWERLVVVMLVVARCVRGG